MTPATNDSLARAIECLDAAMAPKTKNVHDLFDALLLAVETLNEQHLAVDARIQKSKRTGDVYVTLVQKRRDLSAASSALNNLFDAITATSAEVGA